MLNHAYAFIFLLGDLTTLEVLITFASYVYLHIYKILMGFLNVNNFNEMLNHTYAFIFLLGDLTTLEVLITFAS